MEETHFYKQLTSRLGGTGSTEFGFKESRQGRPVCRKYL